MTEDEMVRWNLQFNELEFEQTLGEGHRGPVLQSMGLQRVDWVTDQQQYKGERSEKEYITQSLCCIPETNMTL